MANNNRPSNGDNSNHRDVVASFVSKLWKIIEKSDYKHFITWSDSGTTFIVRDFNQFSKEVFPLFFKHTNFNSFVRQLNQYGFRKVSRPGYGSLASSQEDELLEFWHASFRRGHPELLHLVQRRISSKNPDSGMITGAVAEVSGSSHHLSTIMGDIHQMKGRQDGIATIIEALKLDNTHLRLEIGVLKDKHIRQQKVLNKIIHFLVHMVYNGKVPTTMRQPPRTAINRLMLTDSAADGPPSKKLKLDGIDDDDEFFSFGDELSSPITELSSFPTMPTPPPPQAQPAVSAIPQTGSIVSPASVSSPAQPLSNPAQSPLSATTSASPLYAPSEDSNTEMPFNPSLEMQFPVIPDDLLTEFPILPAPSSLVPVPHPEKRTCINGQLEHQQLGLDNLREVLSDHLSMDSSLVSDFILSDEIAHFPSYDYVDTARLLESLSSSEDADISHESMLVPIGSGGGGASTSDMLDGIFSPQQAVQLAMNLSAASSALSTSSSSSSSSSFSSSLTATTTSASLDTKH